MPQTLHSASSEGLLDESETVLNGAPNVEVALDAPNENAGFAPEEPPKDKPPAVAELELSKVEVDVSSSS